MIMKAKNVIIVLPPHFHGHLSKSTVIKVLIFEQSYKGNIKIRNEIKIKMDK